jgi:hypothetical protein
MLTKEDYDIVEVIADGKNTKNNDKHFISDIVEAGA